ncbi:uncharacterized protein AMSG_05269 [Thecamonas trahens ATCC 50062]|uniref:RING-type domain-containing protein n=1 Tax=Thecamonas trahens ATCC 50062 TaxID=461836 RepID=A0A0L0DA92_THETB|nr:hypothetical protein AMSG_05269 [Thecamonas trahens ATCC 50062]KNC49274.1 hypothetical protein AMSG_05269 [Thecamonas trahens ATCC 50062]|eukprot:XP_013757988.1 hypothetical protein AMSG_05269 [Thecamonas trahens ATCC 50062]
MSSTRSLLEEALAAPDTPPAEFAADAAAFAPASTPSLVAALEAPSPPPSSSSPPPSLSPPPGPSPPSGSLQAQSLDAAASQAPVPVSDAAADGLTRVSPLRAVPADSPETSGIVRLSLLKSISAYMTRPKLQSRMGLPTVVALAAPPPAPEPTASHPVLLLGSSHGLVLRFMARTAASGKRGYVLANVLGSLGSGPGMALGAITAIAGGYSPAHFGEFQVVAAGHASGALVLWNADDARPLKVLDTLASPSPVALASLVLDKPAVLWGDASGALSVTSFSKALLGWKAETGVLVDGQAGRVHDLKPLTSGRSLAPPQIASSSLYAVATAVSVSVISLHPKTRVVFRLPSATNAPASASVGDFGRAQRGVSLTSIACDDVSGLVPVAERQASLGPPTTAAVVELRFLSSSVLLALTSNLTIVFVDAHSLAPLETISVVSLDLAFETAPDGAVSYAPCLAVSGRTAFLLGMGGLYKAAVLTWAERVQGLAQRGKFVSALRLATAFYRGTGAAAVGLPLPHDSPQAKATIAKLIAELLVAYVELFNAALAAEAGAGLETKVSALTSLVVETCVLIRATDKLLPQLYEACCTEALVRDLESGELLSPRETLLQTLEPYLLDGRLRSLAPVLMHDFVELYAKLGKLQIVSRCILNMDLPSLDFHQVVTLCRSAGLWEALIYVFTAGLGDYLAPLDDMFRAWLAAQSRGSESDLGYKLLLYISYTLQGRAFPTGAIPDDHDPVRVKLSMVAWVLKPGADGSPPPLNALLQLDAREATKVLEGPFLDPVLRAAGLDARQAALHVLDTVVCDESEWKLMISAEAKTVAQPPAHDPRPPFEPHVVAAVYTWLANLAVAGALVLSPVFADYVMIYLVSFDTAEPRMAHAHVAAVVSLLNAEVARAERVASDAVPDSSLMAVVAPGDGAPPLHARFASLKKAATRAAAHRVIEVLCRLEGDTGGVLDAYLDEPARAPQVFGVVRELLVTAAVADGDGDDEDDEYDDESDGSASDDVEHLVRLGLRPAPGLPRSSAPLASPLASVKAAVLARLSALVQLDSVQAGSLIVDHFADEHEQVVSSLERFPRLLYNYLKALLDGPQAMLDPDVAVGSGETETVVMASPSSAAAWGSSLGGKGTSGRRARARRARARRRAAARDDPAFLASLQEKYVALMCAYEPSKVLEFVQSHDSYRLDVVLAVCSKHGVTEATAYLLERTGDASGAVDLVMRRFDDAVAASDSEALHKMFGMAIGVCQRTTQREDDDAESRALWFGLLDRTLEPGSGGAKTSLLKPLMLEVLGGMAGHVSLTALLTKILRDHGDREYGEFQDVIVGIMESYRYESVLLQTTNKLLARDGHSYVQRLVRQLSKPCVSTLTKCAMCGASLRSAAADLVTKVFKCGHEFHQECGHGLDVCPTCSGGSGFSAASAGSAEARRKRERDDARRSAADPSLHIKRAKRFARSMASRDMYTVRRMDAVVDDANYDSGLQLKTKREPGSLPKAPLFFAAVDDSDSDLFDYDFGY